MKKSVKPLFLSNLFSDRFVDTWKLLSQTSGFLSRTPVFDQYEEDLRLWRRDLQKAAKDGDEYKRIKEEIIELRKTLRLQGYDLSLAEQTLEVDGFRNDASLGEGFRRLVIFFSDNNAYWISGNENHITLAEQLTKEVNDSQQKNYFTIRSRHYLWYLRKGNKLILSGSDSEFKDNFEHLKAMAEANSLKILAFLKHLR